MSDDRLRASDADRDAVVQILNTAYGAGRITAEEHTERIDAALSAKTFGDLRPLTADLVPSAAPGPAPRPPDRPDRPTRRPEPFPAPALQTFDVRIERLRRFGRWSVPANLRINGLLATIELDLTRALLPAVIDIDVSLIVSTLRLWVPLGTDVRDSTHGILSDHSIRRTGQPDQRAPRVHIGGNVTMSEIKVRGPRQNLIDVLRF